MLELRNITKDYPVGEEIVHALRGVSLQFRRNEFVSILGPSGCGKTTMLNIIGGLDKYTNGDLVINGRSTKDYRDRDWDAYRNHSVGFVFQSYNLIPHQTVLQNVEIALTLSGVSKSERRKRAKEALIKVGLGTQLNKRPREMSGGQMQRVAIARAIVNDPDIILADEPTGALDTETSVQVMNILKEIASDRLVVMVTHNPELAEQYSTRIIRILDGRITGDSAPMTAEEYYAEQSYDRSRASSEARKTKLPSMSYVTSFGLSLKNLFTKKGRTILTSFAGSIGIIGIALVFAVSHGATNYIDSVQEETLASYPLMLESETVDLGSMLTSFIGSAKSNSEHRKNAVYEKSMLYDLITALSNSDQQTNDLRSFRKYLEEAMNDPNDKTGLRNSVSGVSYTYPLDLQIYTKAGGEIIHSDAIELMQKIFAKQVGVSADTLNTMYTSNPLSSMMSTGSYAIWQEMLRGSNGETLNKIFYDQYDLLYGEWPENYDEVVLVVDKNNELDDLTLYALGLLTEKDIDNLLSHATGNGTGEKDLERWSYRKICGLKFRTILPCDAYVYDEETGCYSDLRTTDSGLKYLYSNGLDLTVTGVIRPKENVSTTIISGSMGYTYKLTEYVIEHCDGTEAVKAQRDTPDTDIFTGLLFKEYANDLSEAEKAKAFMDFIDKKDTDGKADAYISIMSVPNDDEVAAAVKKQVSAMSTDQIAAIMSEALSGEMAGIDQDTLKAYVASMSKDEVNELVGGMIEMQYRENYASEIEKKFAKTKPEKLAAALDKLLSESSTSLRAEYFDTVLSFSSSTFEKNLQKLGCIDMDEPYTINLYSSSFAAKDAVKDAIEDYNEKYGEDKEISYTDYVGIIMSSVTTIISAITYLLISFVAISLVVSSIMIGVITLISVQERTKEIGILRAIGASKRNVSGMFNAETVIIGFTSGLLGIVVTYLLMIPINIILHRVTGIQNLSTNLPILVALLLICISMFLTLIAGIIPSRSAAKKDPVVALRSE